MPKKKEEKKKKKNPRQDPLPTSPGRCLPNLGQSILGQNLVVSVLRCVCGVLCVCVRTTAGLGPSRLRPSPAQAQTNLGPNMVFSGPLTFPEIQSFPNVRNICCFSFGFFFVLRNFSCSLRSCGLMSQDLPLQDSPLPDRQKHRFMKEKRANMEREREHKARNFGPPPFGLHPFGIPPCRLPLFLGSGLPAVQASSPPKKEKSN